MAMGAGELASSSMETAGAREGSTQSGGAVLFALRAEVSRGGLLCFRVVAAAARGLVAGGTATDAAV